MAVHVAIVSPPYDRLILEGRKRIESRFTQTARPPFGAIKPGDRLYFKRSGGRFFARAEADRVLMADRLTAERVDALVERYNDRICGAADYWRSRRGKVRYATLIWLRGVRPASVGPAYRPGHMRAWYVLDDEAAPEADRAADTDSDGAEAIAAPPEPAFEVQLSEAAIRQRTVRVGRQIEQFPPACIGGGRRDEAGEPITLELEDGPTVETDIDGRRRMIRWRGWGQWFAARAVTGGDRLQFIALGPRHFMVRPADGVMDA